jgi:hypothetical protein
VKIDADNQWKRQKVCNVKFSIDKQSPLTALIIPRGQTAQQHSDQIKKFIMWLS